MDKNIQQLKNFKWDTGAVQDRFLVLPLFKEWVEEERREAAEEAAISKTRELIIELLTRKFDFIPNTMREQLSKVDDQVALDYLFRKISKITELEEFEKLIKKVIS